MAVFIEANMRDSGVQVTGKRHINRSLKKRLYISGCLSGPFRCRKMDVLQMAASAGEYGLSCR